MFYNAFQDPTPSLPPTLPPALRVIMMGVCGFLCLMQPFISFDGFQCIYILLPFKHDICCLCEWLKPDCYLFL